MTREGLEVDEIVQAGLLGVGGGDPTAVAALAAMGPPVRETEMSRLEQNLRPKRLVLLSCWLVLIGGIVYSIHILCTFFLKLADNERFVAHVAATLKKCGATLEHCTSLGNLTTPATLAGQDGGGGD